MEELLAASEEHGTLFYLVCVIIAVWFVSSIVALDRQAIQNGKGLEHEA